MVVSIHYIDDTRNRWKVGSWSNCWKVKSCKVYSSTGLSTAKWKQPRVGLLVALRCCHFRSFPSQRYKFPSQRYKFRLWWQGCIASMRAQIAERRHKCWKSVTVWDWTEILFLSLLLGIYFDMWINFFSWAYRIDFSPNKRVGRTEKIAILNFVTTRQIEFNDI